MAAHDWESDDGTGAPMPLAGARARDWDDDDAPARRVRAAGDIDSDVGTECNSDSDLETQPEGELLAYLLELFDQRVLLANHFCIIMHWVAQLKQAETLKPYGFRPNAPSSHFQRHLDSVLGSYKGSDKAMRMEIPGYSSGSYGRTTLDFHITPSHEFFSEFVASDAAARNDLREAVASDMLPMCYGDHPVVQEHGTPEAPVRPMAIFIDGLPYAIDDSVLGFWVTDVISNCRHLTCVLRKRLMCRCGCRGWCTLWPIFVAISWMFESFRDGVFPSSRPGGSAWLESDSRRILLQGTQIGFRAACIWLKGDWMERITTMGFPSWRDGLRPCAECNGFGEVLSSVDGLRYDQTPWRPNGMDDYYNAVADCEMPVSVSAAHHPYVVELLQFDRSQHGGRGYCMKADFAPLGLRKYDRIPPQLCLGFDVLAFRDLTVFPLNVLFWRQEYETISRHRNPLFNRSCGMEPSRILTQDSLHALFLGVMLVFCRLGVWILIMSGIYGILGGTDERIQLACIMLTNALKRFYRERHEADRDENLTRINALKPKMVGKRDEPILKTKGAETWGLLLFLVETFEKYGAHIVSDVENFSAAEYLVAAKELVLMVQVMSRGHCKLARPELDRLMDHWKRFVTLTEHVDELEQPKRHAVSHMVHGAERLGNPHWYACWFDEALNKTLKKCCQFRSQATFEQAVLYHMPGLLQRKLSRTSRW
jgi:hypothetical protein